LITTDELLLILAAIMLLGFVGEIGFRKKRIPDMLLLLLIGIFIHYSGIIPDAFVSILRELLSFVGIIALTLIVFGGVLKLDLERFGGSVTKGIAIASADIIFVMGILTPFLYFVFKIHLLVALLLSAILSETAVSFVIPLLSRIGAREELKHAVEVETIFNSVLNIIVVLFILNIMTQQSSIIGMTGFLFASISEAIVLGGVVGVVWLIVLKHALTSHYYVATIAMLLVLWGVSDYLNASAILSVFIFSIIIANSSFISRIIRVSEAINTQQLDTFNSEITFIVLTFFYVYIGILVNVLDFRALLIAFIVVVILVAIRFLEIFSLNGMTKWFGRDATMVSSFVQRGPTVIVLLGILLSLNPSIFKLYGNTIFYTVILTILAGSILFSISSRKYISAASPISQPIAEMPKDEVQIK